MTDRDSRQRVSIADLHAIAREIQAFWGAHLYVRVVPDVTPCMNWREVLIPDDFSSWNRDELQQTLLHEWGHRMISPVSPKIGAIWRRIAEKTGLSERQAALAVNLVADVWVDLANLENQRWGQAYCRGHSESITGLEQRIAALANDPETPPMLPFMRLLAALNRRLLEEAAASGPESKPTIHQPDNVLAAADGLWEVLTDYGRTEEERVQQVSVRLRKWLPEEERVEVVLYPRFHPFSGREEHGGNLTDHILLRGRRGGLTPADFDDLFGRSTVEELKLRNERLKMYASVVPAVETFLSHRRRKAFEGYKLWRPGGRLADLDVAATLQRSSVIIPGVTTLARNFNKRGYHSGRGSGGVILVVDDSGSTDGDVLRREKEASFAIIAAARQFGDPVGCVVFGSEVTFSIPPTSQYSQVEDLLCRLDSESGGTTMEPALRKALQMTYGRDGFTIMIMTDAEIADSVGVRTVAWSFPLESHLVAFCFNSSESVREGLGTIASRIRLFYAAPDVPFVEAALEEIYG